MKKTRIRFFKFSDGKQNLQFHWPNRNSNAQFVRSRRARHRFQNILVLAITRLKQIHKL